MDAGLYTAAAGTSADGDGCRTTRRDQVYGTLTQLLMAGEFPVQARLVEERIAARLGVSRTPVREALVRLLADGLVIRQDGAYYVALPNLTQFRNLYELRIVLEQRGVARAIEAESVRHDPGLLEPLRDAWQAMADDFPEPSPDFVVLDEDFHVTLLAASGSDVLTDTLRSVNARIRTIRMYDFLTEDRIECTVREHLAVVEGVLAGRLKEALQALRQHVGVSMEVVERRAARAISQMAMGGPRQ
jgi:DNA-binding GntR family transcriptional regulator